MHSGKLFNFFKQGIAQAGKNLGSLSDPNVGSSLIKLQYPKLLIRVDGRSHREFFQDGGLLARNTLDELLAIRFSSVVNYQVSNLNPFAWGACSNITELETFLTENKMHTDNGWIHMFYGDATCLRALKVDTGIEGDGLDRESEQLVIKDLPFSRWLASTCPKYRAKFLEGGLVPNAMLEFNEDVPHTLCKQDLASESAILCWLLLNNSEEVFSDLCQHLYKNVSPEALTIRFKGEVQIIDAIQYFLKMSEQQSQPKL